MNTQNIQILDDLTHEICILFIKRFYKEVFDEELEGSVDVIFHDEYGMKGVDIADSIYMWNDIYTAEKFQIPCQIVQDRNGKAYDNARADSQGDDKPYPKLPNLYNYWRKNS